MTKEDIKRKIMLYGLKKTIEFLTSDQLSEEDKKSLSREHVLVDGYPCISLLYFLSSIAL